LVLSAPDDGSGDLLTAFEVTDMPLSSVNLAVLSACETGLGELKNGDGIHGLQYAFFSAGVRSVLLSLWQVNDEVTKEYMDAFYEKLLETGNKREAYEYVSAYMRKKYYEPRYWAAFIYLGD
ncbi:MAG: CHAT domain-containing protein, partial [Cyclobacteriaceae bacterium]